MKKHKGDFDATNSFLYQKCLKEWWPALDANREIIHYKKGEILFKEGEKVQGVFFMLEGVVKVHKHWGQDKELIIRFAHNYDIVGHRGLSTNNLFYPVTATALTNCTICFLDLDFFMATIKVNTQFMYDFMMFMADELQLSEQRMSDLAHMPVKGRAAKALLELQQKFGINAEGYIAFTISRQDISAFIGTTYESVYKLMAEFTESGLIKTNSKDIAIIDTKGLKALTC
jgi:CRP/FNR family transcriptional regulator